MRFIIFLFILIFSDLVQAQERKILQSMFTDKVPIIDGILSEDLWNDLNPATDFTLMWPETRNGIKIPNEFKTTAYVCYDDNAIYVGAILKLSLIHI